MQEYTLEQLLMELSGEDFAWLTEFYGILWNKKSAMRKRAISGIVKRVQDPDQLFDEAVVLSEEQWKQFLEIKKAPLLYEEEEDIPFFFSTFLDLGYLYEKEMEDGNWLVMPLEIKQLLESKEWKQLEQIRKQASDVFFAAMAAVHLYGAIDLQDFAQLFNSMFEENLAVDMIFDLLLDLDLHEIASFAFWSNYLVHEMFEEEEFEGVHDLLQRSESKPRYIPEKEVFLKYADPFYFETNAATEAMLQYLKGDLDVERQEADVLLIELHGLCSADVVGNQLQYALDLLAESDISFHTKENVERFAQLLYDMMDNTRLWHNNGHTPKEMLQINGFTKQKPQWKEILPKARPDRGSLCPCGSGKIYRKCCGKNENIIDFPARKR